MLWATLLARRVRGSERAMPPVLPNGGVGVASYWDLVSAFRSAGAEMLSQPGAPARMDGSAYRSNSAVFACCAVRQAVLSEAMFRFQERQDGRFGRLYGSPMLDMLESPWPGASTGDLIAALDLDATMAGNSYWVANPAGAGLVRLDPGHVEIVMTLVKGPTGHPISHQVEAYKVQMPGSSESELYAPEQVAHYKPIPDPDAPWVGMSWLRPLVHEVRSDHLLTQHKVKSLENRAVFPVSVTYPETASAEVVKKFRELFETGHAGPENSGRTLHIGGGADVTVIGQSFKDLELRAVQGAGETRIAAAAGIPPIIVGFSEGLDSATYSNYGQARRRWADASLRPTWRAMSSALERLVAPPVAFHRLWFDDRDISFLQEDVKDEAEIHQMHASTIRTLIDAGFEPDAATAAVMAGDLEQLIGTHSGLYSVQLQPPGANDAQPDEA